MRGRPTFEKRRKEMARKEKKQDKAERREQRKAEKADRTRSIEDGEDPDLAGIKPGPQPLPEAFESLPGDGVPEDQS
jgi:hypothetical protein